MSLSKASSSSGSNNPQRTYLLTYSAIDPEIFPTRQSFGEACAEAFGECVDYYAVCKEWHTTDGEHYHASFKLTKPRRWGAPKKHLMSQYNAVVNFREPDENNCMNIYMHTGISRRKTKKFSIFLDIRPWKGSKQAVLCKVFRPMFKRESQCQTPS